MGVVGIQGSRGEACGFGSAAESRRPIFGGGSREEGGYCALGQRRLQWGDCSLPAGEGGARGPAAAAACADFGISISKKLLPMAEVMKRRLGLPPQLSLEACNCVLHDFADKHILLLLPASRVERGLDLFSLYFSFFLP